MAALRKIQFSVGFKGREQIWFEAEVDQNENLCHSQVRAIGDLALLELVESWRSRLQGPLHDLPLPVGEHPGAMMLRELILKIKGLWEAPIQDDMICHCRAVSTETVDCAIVHGAHTTAQVTQQTSASTGCGTCRGDVQSLIDHRLNRRAQKKSAA
jgi:bacterioferritin-associated ferredoxin